MAKINRNIGREILDGLREIKRGEYGRVINVSDVSRSREKTGRSRSRFPQSDARSAQAASFNCGCNPARAARRTSRSRLN